MTEVANRFLLRLAAAVALACSLLGWPLGALADPATITLSASAGENGTVSYEFQDAKGAVQIRLSKEVQTGETAKSVIDYFENAMKLFGARYKVTRSSETLPGELILYRMKIEPQGETPNFGKVVSKLPSGYDGTHGVDKKASGKAAMEVAPKAPGAPDAIVSGTRRFDLLDQDLNRLAFLTVVADEPADAFDVLRPFYDELASLDFDPLLASAGEGGASLSLLSQNNPFFGVGRDDTRFALSMSDELLVRVALL
jgi:hypothetical protein